MRFETSKELYLSPFQHGVKILTPEAIQGSRMKSEAPTINGIRVSDLLDLPLNVYFLNTESELIICNEQNVHICGYDSFKDALGTTIKVVSKASTGDQIIYNDKKAMQENKLQIIEETHVKVRDGFDVRGLSFKMSLYNSDNKIHGVFGMTARLEEDAAVKLDEGLSHIVSTGLFPLGDNPNKHNCIPGMKLKDIYFSSQETSCLHQLIRGKSIKSIALHLGLSPRTVESYLENMRFKANVHYTSELIEMVIDSIYDTALIVQS